MSVILDSLVKNIRRNCMECVSLISRIWYIGKLARRLQSKGRGIQFNLQVRMWCEGVRTLAVPDCDISVTFIMASNGYWASASLTCLCVFKTAEVEVKTNSKHDRTLLNRTRRTSWFWQGFVTKTGSAVLSSKVLMFGSGKHVGVFAATGELSYWSCDCSTTATPRTKTEVYEVSRLVVYQRETVCRLSWKIHHWLLDSRCIYAATIRSSAAVITFVIDLREQNALTELNWTDTV